MGNSSGTLATPITATVCKLATQSLAYRGLNEKKKETPSGQPNLGWFIVDIFGTLLEALGVTPEIYNQRNRTRSLSTSRSMPGHSANILHPRSRHSLVGVSRAIYEAHCCISKLSCKGCTVGFSKFSSPYCSTGGRMGQYGLLSPSLVTHVP